IMSAHMQAQEIPTAVVAVVKDGKLFFSKGYGYADREQRTSVDPERTLFRPGSVSKLFTWTAVMQLHERGQLDLDADINTYLKDFQIPATYPEPITMKHLLTHTPGFEDGALGYLFVRNAEKIVPLGQSLAAHIPLRVRPPGTYSSYSNYGTALAGLIVANISGMSFEDYIDKNILAPLGMTHSTFHEPLPPSLAADMATGYKHQTGIYKKQDFEFIANFGPAGALTASANDMARFMLAHLQLGRLGDARILQEATARQMHSQLYTLDPRLAGMAYGFYETRVNGVRMIGHGGDTQWFHSDLSLLPEHNLGIYASYVTHGSRARSELLKAFMDRYFPQAATPLPTPPDDFKERGKRFAGNYRFTRHNSSTIEKVAAVAAGLSVSVTSENRLLVSGLGENALQFVETEPLLFRQVDGTHTISFKENERGEVTHMFFDALPFMPTYRVPWYEARGFTLLIVGGGLLLCVTTLISAFYHARLMRRAAIAAYSTPASAPWPADSTPAPRVPTPASLGAAAASSFAPASASAASGSSSTAATAPPRASRWAIRLAVLAALLTLAFAVSLIAVVQASQDSLIYELPASLGAVLVLPILTSILAAAIAILA
ncbi:MAG: serine hydrolase domain-containing protein, partial [Candidatus Acidiferrales bacterium]